MSEVSAKSILRRQRGVDSWFLASCGMNLYRGCAHNCAYCDGRAERYRVAGEFGASVQIKANAVGLLRRELDPARRRTPFPGGYVLLGGGVGDSYQPAEAEARLSRRVLELLAELRLPVHVLTKSTLVERDTDLLERIHSQRRAIVSFSISTGDDRVAARFEPGAAPPTERLRCLERLKARGLPCGIYLMPLIPFISDGAREIEESVSRAADAGADFVIFGGMTLKEGRQQEYFLKELASHRPELVVRYRGLYPGDPWGAPVDEYTREISARFAASALRRRIPARIPLRLFEGMLGETDLVAVLLEHLDCFLQMRNRETSYGRAARAIRMLGEPIRSFAGRMQEIRGVGPVTARLIEEILATGTCRYYERLAPYAMMGADE